MKAEDLKTKTEDELKKLLLETRKAQFNNRFEKTNGTLADTSKMRKDRRTIARIKTFLNAKTAEAAAPKKEKKAAAKKPAAKKAPAKKTTKAKKDAA